MSLGIPLGPTAARGLLNNMVENKQVDYIDDFARLPDWCQEMTKGDPRGHYILTTTRQSGSNRFQSLLVVPSSAIEIYKANSAKIMAIDGCGVRTIPGGALLGAFCLSSNRELQLLAFQHCASENGPECEAFVGHLKEYFGQIDLILQDAGASLISACAKHGIRWRRCAQHICKNLRQDFHIPADFDDLVYILARATTKQQENACLQKMRDDFPKYGDAVEWLEERLPQFVSQYFLDDGLHNFTEISNNAAEASWKFINAARSLSVLGMVTKIFQLFSKKQLKERDAALDREGEATKQQELGQGTRLTIVPCIVEALEEARDRVLDKEVVFTLRDKDELRAVVTLSQTAGISAQVYLCKSKGRATCSNCRSMQDSGYMCDCMLAVVHAASQLHNLAPHWSIYMMAFLHKHWTLAEWVGQKRVVIELNTYARAPVDLADNDRLLPWQNPPVKPGRKKKGHEKNKDGDDGKKKRKRKGKRKTEGPPREYLCGGCGKPEHSINRCTEINLDFWRASLEQRRGSVKSTKPRLSKAQRALQLEAERVAREKKATGGFVSDGAAGFVWGAGGGLMQDHDSEPNGGEEQNDHSEGSSILDSDHEWVGMADAVEQSRQSNAAVLATHMKLMEVASKKGLVENRAIAVDGSCFFDAVRDQLQIRRGVITTCEEVCFVFCFGFCWIF